MDGAPGRHAGRDLARPPLPRSGRPRVVMLGGDELSREVVISLQRLGAEVVAVSRHADAGLRGVADESLTVDLSDPDALTDTLRWLRPKIVLPVDRGLPVDALTAALDPAVTTAAPSIRGAALAVDPEALRRLAADELGLPTAPFWFAGSVDELRAIADHAGLPLLVKPVEEVLGEGRSVVLRADDIEPAWRRAVAAGDRDRVLAESVVEVECEVTLLTVAGVGPNGPTVRFASPIGHRTLTDDNGRLAVEYWQPQPLTPIALDSARSIAARIARALGGRGVFGVELLVCGDEVYFVGVNAHPHDSALLTRHTQRLSGFDLAARAILGLPTDSLMLSPGAARLIYSRAWAPTGPSPDAPADPAAVVAEALQVPESDVLLFDQGRYGVQPRRRLGAVLVTASEVDEARRRATAAATVLGKLWV